MYKLKIPLLLLVCIVVSPIRSATAQECDFFQVTFLENFFGRKLAEYTIFTTVGNRGYYLSYCGSTEHRRDTRQLKRKHRSIKSQIRTVRARMRHNRANGQSIAWLKNRELVRTLSARLALKELALSDLEQSCSAEFLAVAQVLLDGYKSQLLVLQEQLAACGETVTLPF